MTTRTHALSRALPMALFVAAIALTSIGSAQLAGDPAKPGYSGAMQAQRGAELERARAAVAEARAAAIGAKAELEAAVATPIEERRAAGSNSPRESTSAGRTAKPSAAEAALVGAATSEIELLKKLLTELKAERTDLLKHMTMAHPLIIDADLRIEEYEQQLAALRGGKSRPSRPAAEVVEPRAPLEPRPPAEPQIASLPGEPAEGRHEAALRLEHALGNWENAQQKLQSAIDAESAAAERLAALAAHWSAEQHPAAAATTDPAATPSSPVTASPPATSAAPRENYSQPLVLAALIVALVVAAVASIKLARGLDDTVFAGADDVASTLALPVVGVIPATAPAWARAAVLQRYRVVTFTVQMLVAVVIFAAVAYCVQNPLFLWQLCTDPLETLRGSR